MLYTVIIKFSCDEKRDLEFVSFSPADVFIPHDRNIAYISENALCSSVWQLLFCKDYSVLISHYEQAISGQSVYSRKKENNKYVTGKVTDWT